MEERRDAKAFVEALERDKTLRQEAFSAPRKHLLEVARRHGYTVAGPDLHDAMRERWANEKVPPSANVNKDDDPDTCCACTFSESPEF